MTGLMRGCSPVFHIVEKRDGSDLLDFDKNSLFGNVAAAGAGLPRKKATIPWSVSHQAQVLSRTLAVATRLGQFSAQGNSFIVPAWDCGIEWLAANR